MRDRGEGEDAGDGAEADGDQKDKDEEAAPEKLADDDGPKEHIVKRVFYHLFPSLRHGEATTWLAIGRIKPFTALLYNYLRVYCHLWAAHKPPI